MMARDRTIPRRWMLVSMAVTMMIVFAGIALVIPLEKDEEKVVIGPTSSVDGVYWVPIREMDQRDPEDVTFRLKGPDGKVISVMDPSGKKNWLAGDIDPLRMSDTRYEIARNCEWPGAYVAVEYGIGGFYSDYPEGQDNRTLFILYMDQDPYGKIGKGDYFFIRSEMIGGPVGKGARLELVDEREGGLLGYTIFGESYVKRVTRVVEREEEYRIRILDTERYPIEDLRVKLLNHNKIITRIDDEDGQEFWMNTSLSDFVFSQSKFDQASASGLTNSTFLDRYYVDAEAEFNYTLNMVFMDEDGDGHLSAGDVFWVRRFLRSGYRDEIEDARGFVLSVQSEDYGLWFYEHLWPEGPEEIEWEIGIEESNYVVTINNITVQNAHDIGFKILDQNRLVVTTSRGSYHGQRLEDDISDIEFDQVRFNSAYESKWQNSTSGDWFFADYPEGSSNLTLWTTWFDADEDRFLSKGDRIFIRSQGNGGLAENGYFLRLIDKRRGEVYGDIEFPYANEISPSIDAESIYSITFGDWTTSNDIEELEFALLNSTGATVMFNDVNGEVLRINGTCDEILQDIMEFHASAETRDPDAVYGTDMYSDQAGDDNRTLYIVFIDENDNGYVNHGDRFLIRSNIAGGPGQEGFRFVLKDGDGMELASTMLPEPIDPTRSSIGINNGDFLSLFHDVDPIDIDDVHYEVWNWEEYPGTTPKRYIATALDPGGNIVGMRGNLSAIVYDQVRYDSANGSDWPIPTFNNIFYADYPMGVDNSTLFILFVDTDSNEKLTSGDYLWIRSLGNAGSASHGDILVLETHDGRRIGSQVLYNS